MIKLLVVLPPEGKPKPQLTKEPTAVTVFYTKEKVTLKCKVTEDSEGWTYLWFKGHDKTSHANTMGQSQLSLSLVTPADSGSYWCKVERTGFQSEYSNDLALEIKGKSLFAYSFDC